MKKRVQRSLVLIMGAFLLVSTVFYLQNRFSAPQLPVGLIQAAGRIEGDRVTVAAKFAGRIERLSAFEGDEVKKDQVLAEMDDSQVQARLAQAEKALAALEETRKAAQTRLELLRKEVPLAEEQAQAALNRAEAAFREASAREEQARRDVQRYRQLFQRNVVPKQAFEQVQLSWTVARSSVDTAAAAREEAEKQLTLARLGPERIQAQEDELASLDAKIQQAGAAVDEASSVSEDMTILAPSDGTIITRMADAGEVLTAGGPLFELVDLDRLYLKVYVPEIQIGKIRLGLKARVFTDAFPDRHFEAVVRTISSRAEFTPKEAQTKDERTKLVYWVKLYLDENPDHLLTPGLPADAVIRWKEEVPWSNPVW